MTLIIKGHENCKIYWFLNFTKAESKYLVNLEFYKEKFDFEVCKIKLK